MPLLADVITGEVYRTDGELSAKSLFGIQLTLGMVRASKTTQAPTLRKYQPRPLAGERSIHFGRAYADIRSALMMYAP